MENFLKFLNFSWRYEKKPGIPTSRYLSPSAASVCISNSSICWLSSTLAASKVNGVENYANWSLKREESQNISWSSFENNSKRLSYLSKLTTDTIAQSAGVVEYTDCFSAEGYPPPANECPGNDTKQSDGEVPAMLELLGMRITPLLPSLPGPLGPGEVAPDRVLSMG